MFATKATEPSTKTFIKEDTADNNSLRYKGLLKSEDIPCDFAANVLGTLLEKYHENYFEYLSTYAFGSVFNNTVIEMWINPLSLLGSWILQNLIDTTLLIQQTGQPNARFDTGISVVQMTTEEAKDGESKSEGPLEEVKDFIMYNWLYWGLLIPMSIGLITSSFVVNPSNEILNEARDLQLMTGVSGFLYIGTNFVFDLLFYMTPLTAIYFGFAMTYNLSGSTQATMVLVMLSSAPVNIFLPYLICEHSADGGSAYAAILGIYAVGGPALVLAYLFTTTFNEERDWRNLFLFFPSFQLPAASVRAVSFEKEMTACDYMRQKKSRDDFFCWFAGKFSSAIKYCCDVLKSDTEPWHNVHILSSSGEGILYDISLMLIYGIFIFCYLLYHVSTSCSWRSALPEERTEIHKDADVEGEWAAVEEMCNRSDRNFANSTLVARRLHKSYGKLQVVKELSLALRPAEFFGLLGVNGAGKTTTFRMLTALTPMTYGEAFMGNVALSKEPRKWQSKLGFCPQRDSLLGKLNAHENLYLFGRLRGVPEESLPDIVRQMIEVTGLQEHADKRCDYYSMEECEVACDRICIMVQGTMVCLGTLQHLKDKFGKGCNMKFLLGDASNIQSQEIIEAVGKVFPGMKVLNKTQEQIQIRTREKLPWSIIFRKLETLEKVIGFEQVLASDTTLEQLFIEFAEKGQN